MSNEPKRYLITAALPYANGPIHIGHVAGCYLPADIYVRFLKLMGKDVLFICGSDEHGVPITIKAKKENVSPQQVVDKYNKLMKETFEKFGIDFSYYGRTSSKVHHKTASDFFKVLYDKGVFSEETTQQYYDEKAGQFLADRYITGTCPRCKSDGAYGDQCEKCGSSLSPTELINPKSALSGAEPVLKETKNWFLPMGEIQKSEEFNEYLKRIQNWKSNIKGQCQSWLKDGLLSRAMTRDLDWGVKVPIEGAEGKVLYVWFDAPIGYISATIEYFNESEEWKKWWQDEETALLHFIGKDNIVFHSIIFPMMLMKHGSFNLPSNVPANEFLNLEGDKISTSRNWAVWLHEYMQDFPDRRDELRYVLTSISPETKDSEFTWKDYQTRVNSELVGIFGNYINRVLVLYEKFYEAHVPSFNAEAIDIKITNARNTALTEIGNSIKQIEDSLNTHRQREALAEFINIARAGNKYLAETEPWKLIKTDTNSVAQIMFDAIQICAKLSIIAKVFLPDSSLKIAKLLNSENLAWVDLKKDDLILSGHKLNKAEILFKPLEDAEIDMQLERLKKIKESQVEIKVIEIPALKPDINFEDFEKLDLRIGKILEAEKVPKADKLLKFKVDLGFEQRTILSGIAEHYKSEDMIGKNVVVVANLAPRKIRGIESQGMLLMAGDDNKLLCIISEADIAAGSKVK